MNLHDEDRSEEDSARYTDELKQLVDMFAPSKDVWDNTPVPGRPWPMFGFLLRYVHWTSTSSLNHNKVGQVRHMPPNTPIAWICAHCGWNENLINKYPQDCASCLRRRVFFWKCLVCSDGLWNIVGIEFHCYCCQSAKSMTDAVSGVHFI
jgi:hypothetical protein